MKTGEVYISEESFSDINVEKGDCFEITAIVDNMYYFTNKRSGMKDYFVHPCNLEKALILKNISYEIY